MYHLIHISPQRLHQVKYASLVYFHFLINPCGLYVSALNHSVPYVGEPSKPLKLTVQENFLNRIRTLN